ncbi:cysteine desulfurase-like protein [Ammoniphilus sp. CFH 90114]|uniref:cysteine desulfurase-like protein n=1 Tax=Ammoniphilus sp. CFH 90114 TaxID=2493665 RepID=UPI00100F1148|nr:cysteine desulfurase-like protein [Ammoniphilus sp. CFH 90114]RXT06482.1 cysteine desulfurase-like protein [Ammoniphilus sp. CFH 90114]
MSKAAYTFPIQRVRDQFPALRRMYHGKSVGYFDGPGGSQVVKASIDAISAYMMSGGANLHGCFPSSVETEEIILQAKQAVADFVGATPNEVAFGANMTTLALSIARAMGKTWNKGDEIVVTELDHRANVDPWITMAEDKGVTVRWIKVNPDTLTLDESCLESVITEKTKLVAVGLASNAVGTINSISNIAKHAHRMGAVVVVDAVHAAPHLFIDRDELGADILLCSAYKFFGPHVGIAVIKEELFESLLPYKLAPAPAYIPDKLETGTQNHEGIAGIEPAIDFIASLAIEGTTRRERLRSGFEQIEEHEQALARKIRDGLSNIRGIKIFQANESVLKTPTIAFRLEGVSPREICEKLCEEQSIFVADGDFYAMTLAERLGIRENGGWVRAGLAPYNTEEEAERLVHGVRMIASMYE